jgi:DNA repair ATPase RecN
MAINNIQANSTNKPENSKHTDSSNSIIKKIGKKENYYVNESTNKYIKEGDEIVMSKFTCSGKVPKPDIIGEILKRLEKMDSKLDNIEQVQKAQGEKLDKLDERITNIELIQKIQGEEIRKINTKVDKIDERLTKLENKVENVIILNNLKLQ